MNEYFINYLIDIIVLAIVYFPLTIFSFKRLFKYLNLKYTKGILYLIISIFLLLPISLIIQQTLNTRFTITLYYLAYLLIGTMLYFMIFTILLELIRLLFRFKKKYYKYLGYAVIILTLFVSIYSYVNTLSYKEETIIITSPKIEQDIRLVQLSDIHLFGAHSKTRFNEIYLKAINKHPDFIVITGDFFDYPGKISEDTVNIVNDYNIPVFFVYGNHDVMVGDEIVDNILYQTNIITLNNETYSIDGITLTGIKDKDTKTYLNDALNNIDINKDEYNILLNHKPQEVDIASEKGYDLMLSGHTHAGQLFPMNLIEYLFNPYFRGLYEIGDLKLYVNQGTYVWGFKMRNFSRNEITIFELKK